MDEFIRQRSEQEERDQRVRRWTEIAEQIGMDYARFNFSHWVYFGKEAEQARQKKALQTVGQFIADLPRNIADGVNCIWYGPVGSGKDAMLSLVMRVAVLKHGLRLQWWNGMNLLAQARDLQRFQSERTEEQLVNQLVTVPVLAISDLLPPTGALDSRELGFLQQVIDGRYRTRRPILLTLNVTDRAELDSRMSSQLADRITDRACVLPCDWASYRQFRKESK